MNLIFKITIILLCITFLTIPSMAETAAEGAFTFQPGDTVEITVVPFPDYSKSIIVREDFKISYPFISGAIDVRNITPAQLKDIITAGLKKIMKNPMVNVDITNFAKLEVYISGEVKTPGKYEVRRNAKLLEALVTAGITEKSDLEKVSLVKGDKQTTVNIKKILLGQEKNMSKNLRLDSRDIIYVPEINKKVSVTGYVKSPGAYVINEKMHTVIEAIDGAGGVLNLSATDGNMVRKLTLVRKGQTILTEDLNDLYKKGNISANMELEDGDILFISEEKLKFLVSVAGQLEKPGIYEIQEGDRVLDTILMAGGVTKQSIVDEVNVIRRNGEVITIDFEALMEDGDVASNVPVLPGDTILVTKPGKRIIVAGDIKTPGVYTLEENGTVLDALVIAGAYKKPKLSEIGVFRNINGKSEIIEIDADQLFSTPTPDPKVNVALLKGDVVYVPEAGKFDASAFQAISTFVWPLTTLINVLK